MKEPRGCLELELRGGLEAIKVARPPVLQLALHAHELHAEVRLRHRAPDQVRVERIGLLEQRIRIRVIRRRNRRLTVECVVVALAPVAAGDVAAQRIGPEVGVVR